MGLRTKLRKLKRYLFPPEIDRFNKWLETQHIKSYSQYKQDLFVHYFYRNSTKKSLFFVDIGAHDGISLSNTYGLEHDSANKWGGGVLIEADSEVFEKCLKNRPNPNIAKYNVALCNKDEEIEFLKITGPQMLSGIMDAYDKRHLERIERKVAACGGKTELIKMQGATFDTIMKNHQTDIDYLSIDVEGGEMQILQCIDFDKYNITLIGIENNYKTRDIPDFLQARGYKKIFRISCDEFYMKKDAKI